MGAIKYKRIFDSITGGSGGGGGGGITSLPISRCLFVSAESGNDGTALRGRFDKPFATIPAAMTASVGSIVSPDNIIVYPCASGGYDAPVILKNGTNIYFQGAFSLGNSVLSFDDNNVAVNCKIYGSVVCRASQLVVHVQNAASNILVEGMTIMSGSSYYAVRNVGNLRLNNVIIDNISLSGNQGGIELLSNGLMLDNVRIVTDVTAESISAAAPYNIKIYSNSFANTNTTVGMITNLIPGTLLTVNSNVSI